jgi:methyl-accepting chemotaxis protein
VSQLASGTAEDVQESATVISGLAAMAETLQAIIADLGGGEPEPALAGQACGPNLEVVQ